ncbi:ABC transporter permease [Variovorax sp. AFSI2.2]|uniref:ABC transporter permease n=1 Tax=Variovorax sp. AFSI2.2 TaxID=3384160 RepID=UPI003EBD619B
MTARQHKPVWAVSTETKTLSAALAVAIVTFALIEPQFLSLRVVQSAAFQLPELGILTLAMLLPTLTGGLNLAITYTANIAALFVAWIVLINGGTDAGVGVFAVACVLALLVGGACGAIMGSSISLTGAHPILVSLAMMIFLRGVGEFLTKGGDMSVLPQFVSHLGQGSLWGIPIPAMLLLACLVGTHVFLGRTRLGFYTYMAGSNIEATRYAGVNTRFVIVAAYALSGVLSAIAGIVMMTRFNSVRVGHGESYLLITILACFLGNVDPHGGFGRVLPVAIALLLLQVLTSGANAIGANQHLATAFWGMLLIVVMGVRWLASAFSERRAKRSFKRAQSLAVGPARIVPPA